MKPYRVLSRLAGLLCLAVCSMRGQTPAAPASFSVLVFSKTTMYRHASITNGLVAIRKLGAENGFTVDATEDSSAFTAANLARYKAVVFLHTSGDILDDKQQATFQNYLKSGGGLAGVHAAVAGKVATEGAWPWYVETFCTEFANHKAIEQATVTVEDRTNVSTAHLPARWSRTDEWYNFASSPRGKVHVLASLEENSFHGGTMGADHPVAWCRLVGKGRLWYTALGHTEESYTEPHFLRHLLGGIQIAAGVKPADFTPARDQVLFDHRYDSKNLTMQDATVSELKTASGRALRVVTGQRQQWPGITLRAPGGPWDLSAHGQVAVTLRNSGTNDVRVNCRVDNPGADGTKNCVTDSLALAPGKSGTLKVTLKRAGDGKLGGKLFGMRGYPVTPGGPGTVDPKNITQILLFVNKPAASHAFELEDIRATGTYTPPTASVADAEPFLPFIDAFGQYKHRDWPGKVHSLAELAERRAAEAMELAAQPEPPAWDKYGGWAEGPQLTANGFFRAEKHRGKWWLVDPDGHLFWSHGIDCVRMLDTTPIDERSGWFEDFPGDTTEFREFLSGGYALKGHYAGRSPKTFSFSGANLRRKYGADWRQEYCGVIHRRLRSWGLNTIANWSDESTRLMRRTPYTDAVSSRGAKNIEGSDGYWGKFPDVFDPSFEAGLRRAMAGRKGRSAGDPWCLGYFSDNEMSWGDDTSLALGALKSPPEQAAKKVFTTDLKARYGDIAKLNTAWGTTHESWDALLQSREAPDRKKAHADLTAFYTKAAELYFRTVRETIKAVAPNQLYLGCRFAWVNDRAAVAAGKYCDVVSYNLYQRTVADFKYPGNDRPLIIGEFHFGALDRGMFHTGLVPVANQADRAQAYQDYVLGAVRHPQFVGAHWFQWMDEPTTGRVYDEENYQIGFVDIADTPYRETIEASREVGRRLYEQRIDEERKRPQD